MITPLTENHSRIHPWYYAQRLVCAKYDDIERVKIPITFDGITSQKECGVDFYRQSLIKS